jgi:hypothetical protein
MIGQAFRRVVLARPWLSFVVLCLSFALFGAGTLNLFNLMVANLSLIAEHGAMALADGAAIQFLELLTTLAVSMAAYVVFKACEHALVHGLTHTFEKDATE